jgi:hypothetical protein
MKLTPVVIFLFFVMNKVEAQNYFYDNNHYDKPLLFEVGASIGLMNCLTDIGGSKGLGKKTIKDINVKNNQLCGGLYLSATYQDAVALRLETTFGQVKGYDSILKNVAPSTSGRYERNLSFKTSIKEISLIAEVHPLFIFSRYEDKNPPRASPYFLAGIGFFNFNPQAKLNNTWVDLQPLHTEGQGFAEYPERPNYKLNQINIPLGIGLRYELSRTLNIRAEVIYRILKTDYLDDVSHVYYVDPAVFYNHFTDAKLANALLLYDRRNELNPQTDTPAQRGNPESNDSYFSLNIKLGLILGRDKIRR